MGRLTFCPLRFFYIRLFFRAVSGSQQKRAEGTESPSIALPDTCTARPVVHALHHVAHLLQLTNPRLRLNAPVQRCGIPGTQGALSKKIMTMATSPAKRAAHCHLTSSARHGNHSRQAAVSVAYSGACLVPHPSWPLHVTLWSV